MSSYNFYESVSQPEVTALDLYNKAVVEFIKKRRKVCKKPPLAGKSAGIPPLNKVLQRVIPQKQQLA